MSFTQLMATDNGDLVDLSRLESGRSSSAGGAPSSHPLRRRGDSASLSTDTTGGGAWEVFSEDWDPSYGVPATFDFDDSDDITLAECDHRHVPPARIAPAPMCFIDGRRRVELQLWAEQRVTLRAGARHPRLLRRGRRRRPPGPPESAGYEGVRVRAAIWGGGHAGDFRSPAGRTTAGLRLHHVRGPRRLLARLQDRMRLAEGLLALDAAAQGWTVVLDGPLNRIRSLHHLVTGYVKTHRRQLLPSEQHALVPSLGVGWRTALYAAGSDRYTCYVRVGNPRPGGSRWTGIARLEFPAAAGLEAIIDRADQLAATLPLYAGQPHRDPRAPVNLTLVRNLEHHLGKQMGAEDFAKRAARDAAAVQAA
ncbi:MAG: hypothetical protein R2710_10905 [Acidimicrobiales bacterium]